MAVMLALLLAAPALSIDVEPGCACVKAESLSRRLASVGTGIRVRVRVRKAAAAVVVEAQVADGRSMSREVPAPADECDAVEQMVVLLVTSWTKEPGFAASPQSDGAPDVRKARPAKKGVAVAPVELPRPERDEGPQPPPSPTQHPDAAGAGSPRQLEAAHAETASPDSVAGPLGPGVQLVARGGVTGRSPPATLAAGELALTLTWRSLGLAVSGGLSDATHSTLASGQVSSSAAWGSLGLAAAIPLGTRLSFEAALGGRIFVLTAAASGFTEVHGVTLVSAGAFVEAGMTYRIAGPVVLGAWGSASVRSREERLVVAQVEGGITVPRWQLGAFAGVGVQWR